ncbi:hypothetical protein R1flu_022974 [Riccia fluitans]|uniref:Uncharacterized protein n=1 Tax=Riccia fluitans TaxID=41844 RepID=A0ABD1XQQ8_9MARC
MVYFAADVKALRNEGCDVAFRNAFIVKERGIRWCVKCSDILSVVFALGGIDGRHGGHSACRQHGLPVVDSGGELEAGEGKRDEETREESEVILSKQRNLMVRQVFGHSVSSVRSWWNRRGTWWSDCR